ncbi:hypothetical protein PICSAR132_04533 [Mycobacterium avium subsp. paratuberculosis]|nr:hypothetical protein PICSAR124_03584 [Mycobacterium avium subsp. paratuberculosis]CAG6936683.1 hypothetical protein PICSAR110_04534 [Mycobacterium avium subsp. paratuberculosis]CAG6937198.1 hypothetical protein PICSAR119_04527 [Mycobacterium avium subsp. paratuberculosis]CAG6937359.1 hypothetical protein PICSAR113_04542 [Mycobacterium avium subsp. paratuberculosis]CAG6937475.1 hypothetical protein PICSAR1_04529 [Mycobacterium avium subsp. paratuberculosis]
MNAGSSTDCDIAAANGPRRNSGSTGPAESSPPPAGCPGISAPIRHVMNAAMPALPSTAPS